MIVSFCGHSDTILTQKEELYIKNLLNNLISNNEKIDFYLGGYGNFDNLCANILKSLKSNYNNFQVYFISPYINDSYLKTKFNDNLYDDCIFPPLENTPKKFAIIKRNFWMVDKSDLIICYVHYSFGGAKTAIDYAIKKNAKIINIKGK